MRRLILVLAILLMPVQCSAQAVRDTSYVLPDGTRVLRQVATVDASAADVWNAWTTSDGARSFIAPVISIDLKVGGRWEASYDKSAKIGDAGNIVNEIISYLPLQMLSIRIISTPPNFPNADVAKQVWTVLLIEPVDDKHVDVTVAMAGWKTGPEWDAVYAFFKRGNDYTLQKLQERFTKGPTKW